MAISSLMRRLGFVKLDAYGLVLTPEDRILSIRATVLDDGLGQKIVGWQESDLAAMELERWDPPQQARNPAKPLVNRVALAPTVPSRQTAPQMPQMVSPPPAPHTKPPTTPPPLAQRPLPGMTTAPVRPLAVAQPLGIPAPTQKRPPTPVPLETMPMARVADPAQVGEDGDEWEWEIAVARARAAAEWAEEAAQQLAPPAPVRKQRATSPIAMGAEPKGAEPKCAEPKGAEPKGAEPKGAEPKGAEPKRDVIKSDIWPTTEPLIEAWESPSLPPPPVRVLPRLKSPTPSKPIVVIPTHTPAPAPIPMLSTLPSVSPRAPLQPIVTPRTRPTTGQLPANAPRRFSRGTPATVPDARLDRLGEDTQVSVTPANDDATRPGLLLPSASSTRRVAAKQR